MQQQEDCAGAPAFRCPMVVLISWSGCIVAGKVSAAYRKWGEV
jgi:hypothetical protein